MANRGNIFSALLAGLRDTSGESLSGGVVYFYTPGTVVAKSVYTDADLTTAVDSVELDSNGQAEIYGRGLYDVVVKDADGTTLYVWERVFLGKDVFVATDILADYTATADDSLILVDTAGGNVVVTLPDPATMQQAPYIVKTTSDANTVTILRSGTTINGSANYVLSDQWEGVQIAFDDYNFYTLGNYVSNASIASIATTIATTIATEAKVELATDAEAITGTDTDRAVTPGNLAAAVFPTLFNMVRGLTLSADTDTEHDITIDTGSTRAAADDGLITLGAPLTKQIDAAWAAGSAAGGFPTGIALASDTWYRVFVIKNTTSGAVDGGFDTSATAANLLADATDYTQYRMVGWVLTDSSSNISQIVSLDTTDTANARQKIAADGYYRLPGGMLVQWGTVGAIANNSGSNVTFPLTFDTACLGVFLGGNAKEDSSDIFILQRSLTTSGFRMVNGGSSSSGPMNFWLAIGY